jgi:hypothetical protein
MRIGRSTRCSVACADQASLIIGVPAAAAVLASIAQIVLSVSKYVLQQLDSR